jgi:hypothetical protein
LTVLVTPSASSSNGLNEGTNYAVTSTVIATVTNCWCEHAKCSGAYTNKNRKFKVLCRCACHNNKKQIGIEDSQPTAQSIEDVAIMTNKGGSIVE